MIKKSKKQSFEINGVEKYTKKAKMIFDVGTGPNGSSWWGKVDKNTKIIGIDMLFFPNKKPKNVSVYKFDASKLHNISEEKKIEKHILKNFFIKTKINLENNFDLVVANHVLEHVESPENTIKGISKLVKKNGIVYVGIPDGFNFTDTFYHLIHHEGGGHIQRLTKQQIVSIFKKYGLELISDKVWPDDWLWFEKCFDYKGRGIEHVDQKDISLIADIFRKELTPDKGYYYGWELIFKKNK